MYKQIILGSMTENLNNRDFWEVELREQFGKECDIYFICVYFIYFMFIVLFLFYTFCII